MDIFILLFYIIGSIITVCLIFITYTVFKVGTWLCNQKISQLGGSTKYAPSGLETSKESKANTYGELDLDSINAELNMKRADRLMKNTKIEISEGEICAETEIEESMNKDAINSIRNIKKG